MLVSVTERTREIGTRLAIGAMPADIRTQFLVEAIVISAIGGIIGIALGLGLSALIGKALALPYTPSFSAIFVVVLFTAAIGLLFGFLPAQRASRLPPAQAMRYE